VRGLAGALHTLRLGVTYPMTGGPVKPWSHASAPRGSLAKMM